MAVHYWYEKGGLIDQASRLEAEWEAEGPETLEGTVTEQQVQ